MAGCDLLIWMHTPDNHRHTVGKVPMKFSRGDSERIPRLPYQIFMGTHNIFLVSPGNFFFRGTSGKMTTLWGLFSRGHHKYFLVRPTDVLRDNSQIIFSAHREFFIGITTVHVFLLTRRMHQEIDTILQVPARPVREMEKC